MITGDIVIVSFPYTNLVSFKARPAVVVNTLEDNYNDVIVCLITSVVPAFLSKFSLLLHCSETNNLKTTSVIKVARIVTVEQEKIKAVIGKLTSIEMEQFKTLFKSLVDQ
jgi:mRNA interferase MazF